MLVMKNILTLVLGLVAFGFSASAQITVDGENVAVEINHETSRVELSEMAAAFKAQGVEMRYDNIEWANDHLIRIRVRVKGTQGEIVEYIADHLEEDQVIKVTRKMANGEESLCSGLDCE